ncbi:MAG: cupin domain-containing protein [Gaiellales bacterium]
MAYQVSHLDELEYAERPYRDGDPPPHAAGLTAALGLESSRANVWRYPAGARGRRHIEGAQEEVFLVLEGNLTLALGEPPELVELRAGSIARVGTGTEIQVQNRSDAEARLLIWGAPPVTGQGQLLDDLP